MRILLYAHDGKGLGHTKRMCLIANRLKSEGIKNVLCISGENYAFQFLDKDVECVKLPSYEIGEGVANGQMACSKRLAIGINETVKMRAELIKGIALSYKPDVFLVDYLPSGMQGELVNTLYSLNKNCRLVLGVRANIGHKAFIENNYLGKINRYLLRNYYHYILHYSDEKVCTLEKTSFFRGIKNKICNVGFVVDKRRGFPNKKLNTSAILVTLGSGKDAYDLLVAILEKIKFLKKPVIIVTGPNFGKEAYKEIRLRFSSQRNFVFHYSVNYMHELYKKVTLVISTAGYNSLLEILQYNYLSKIFIARTRQSREQKLNILKFSKHFKFESLGSEDVSAIKFKRMVSKCFKKKYQHANNLSQYDFNGLKHITNFITHICKESVTK